MLEAQAKKILDAKLAKGVPLLTVAKGDFRVIKRLMDECLQADIPCMLGPCTVGS